MIFFLFSWVYSIRFILRSWRLINPRKPSCCVFSPAATSRSSRKANPVTLVTSCSKNEDMQNINLNAEYFNFQISFSNSIKTQKWNHLREFASQVQSIKFQNAGSSKYWKYWHRQICFETCPIENAYSIYKEDLPQWHNAAVSHKQHRSNQELASRSGNGEKDSFVSE